MKLNNCEKKPRWKNGILTRHFIYCPMWTGDACAGVTYTKRDYQRAIDHSRSVAREFCRLMQDDPYLIRYFCRSHADDLRLYDVHVVEARTPAVWGSNGDMPNWDGKRPQVFTGHCTPIHTWKMCDFMRKRADFLEGGRHEQT